MRRLAYLLLQQRARRQIVAAFLMAVGGISPSLSRSSPPEPTLSDAEALALSGFVHRIGSTRLRHAGGVRVLAVPPDGRWLASAGEQDILLWEIPSGRRVQRFECGGVNACEFTSDGHTLVSGHQNRHVRVWDTRTGRERLSLGAHRDQVLSIAISRDDRLVASADSGSRVRIWELATGRLLHEVKGPNEWPMSCRFSDDARELQVAYHGVNRAVHRWSVESGKSLGSRSSTYASGFYYTRDGRYVVAAEEPYLVIRELAHGGERLRLDAKGRTYNAVAASPDGNRFALRHRDRMEVHDLHAGAVIPTNVTPADWAHSCFSSDSRLLYFADKDASRILVFDVEAGTLLTSGHSKKMLARFVAFSPDGKWLATTGPDRRANLRLWDAVTWEEVEEFAADGENSKKLDEPGRNDYGFGPLSFSPDAKLLAGVKDNEVRAWSVPEGELKHRIKSDSLSLAAFLPDGRHLVTGHWSQLPGIRVWDLKNGRQAGDMSDHWNSVTSFASAPLASVVVSGSRDRSVVVWDARSWDRRHLLEGPRDWVTSVGISADGRFAAGCARGSVHVWNVETGKPLWQASLGDWWSPILALSPTGEVLATGGKDLRVFRTASGRSLVELGPFERPIQALAFSPDGSLLAMASLDETVWIWNVKKLIAGSGFE